MIVEYKLDAGPRGMVVPAWVKDGGYYQDPDNFTMVGWTPDAPREFKVPDSVLVLDLAGVISRTMGIHSRYPFKNEEGNTLTDAEVEAQATAWYNSKQAQ